MSTADSIDVRITGNASGAVEASKLSAEAVDAATTTMRQRLIDLGLASRESFGIMGEAASVAAERVTVAGEKVAIATESMKTHYEGLSAAMGKVGLAMAAVTGILAGGEMFEKAIDKTIELTGDNLKLSKSMGISLEAASGLHAAMAKLGIGTDTVTGAAMKLDRQLKTHESAINDLGVKTRESNGDLRNQLDILLDGVEALKGYEAGTNRNIAAQAMFGRGAGDITTLMRLNTDAIEEGTVKAKELGLVTGQDNVDAMRAYKASVNETKEVFEAFWVQIGNEVLPALIKLGNWLESTGPAVIGATRNALKALNDMFADDARVINVARTNLTAWQAVAEVAYTKVASVIEQVTLRLQMFNDFQERVMKFDFSGAETAWKEWADIIKRAADDAAKHVAAVMQQARADIAKINGGGSAADSDVGRSMQNSVKAFGAPAGKKLPDGIISGGKTPKAKADHSAELSDFQKFLNQTVAANSKSLTQMDKDRLKDEKARDKENVGILNNSSRTSDLIVSKWRTGITSISHSWADSLSRMATLQQGFSATIGQLWQSVAGMISNALAGVIESYLTKWLTMMAVKHGLIAADGVTTVVSESAKAGAGGIASMAAAPFPLNLGAPAFGASMAAAAAAFAPAASAEGGWDVPGGFGRGIDGRGGMGAIIHPREMVLPADLADKVRNGGTGGGGITVNIKATDAESVKRLFHNNKSDLAAALKAALRNGVR